MKRVVGRSVAPYTFEGRALTLKILKARRTLGPNGQRISAVPRKSLMR